MRDIEFRGQLLNGRWVYGLLAHAESKKVAAGDTGYFVSNKSGMPFAYQVDPKTVGQYTGNCDKTGKRKYEDDIVKSGNGRVWVIKHGHYRMAMPGTMVSLYGWYMQDGNCQQPLSASDKLIGNATDNPELLTGEVRR